MVHAFPYSPREGTNAWKKHKELPSAVKKERLDRMLEVASKQKTEYARRFIGKTLTVVPETYEEGYTAGYSENYLRVYTLGKIEKRPTRVRVEGLFKDGVIGAEEKI